MTIKVWVRHRLNPARSTGLWENFQVGPGACLYGDSRRVAIMLLVMVVRTRVECVWAADHGIDPKC